ncbi:MAG: Nif3-like dinuclear metal center hexameric protein [Clostridia bacterium]|nr:Nif3-like dinuclear metal center hexameric protein [Clostridia bacterium]
MITVKEIYSYIDTFAPYDTQESWDNSGLNIGSFYREVKTVGFALDATLDVIHKAFEKKCDLIITHHPIIFKPLSYIYDKNPAYSAIYRDIAILSAHTNWDACDGGVNDILAKKIGLKNIEKISEKELSIVRTGKTNLDFSSFVNNLNLSLDTKTLCNTVNRKPENIAVCGGSGGSLVEDLYNSGIDTLVTGEAKHSEIIQANNLNMNLFICGHYETEKISMPVLKSKIEDKFSNLDCFLLDDKLSKLQR